MKKILITALTLISASSFAETYKLECKLVSGSTHEYYVKLNKSQASVCVDRMSDTYTFSGCFKSDNNIEVSAKVAPQQSKGDRQVYLTEGLVSGFDSIEVPKKLMTALEDGDASQISEFNIVYTVGSYSAALSDCKLLQ